MSDLDLDETLAKYVTKPEALTRPELILAYGQPGSGKSHLAATIASVPGVEKVLYLDTEGSTVGVLSRIENSGKIDVIRVDQHETPFQFLNAIVSRLGEKTSYDAVVIDTFDTAQNWAEEFFEEKAPLSRSGEKDGFWKWSQVKEWSIRTAQTLKRIGPVGVLVVHDKEEKSAGGAITKRLLLSGSSKDVLPGIPDVVAYLERKIVDGEPTTVAYFGTDDNKVTKDRFGFPPKVKSATLPKLFRYIEEQSNSTEEKQA